jgi:hypothetical protein
VIVPVLAMPGAWVLTDAPLGKPVTARVTFPVFPVRVSVAVMVVADCEGKTKGEVLESETDRLPPWLPPPWLPPPAEPPQPDKTAVHKDNSGRLKVFNVIGGVIVNQPLRPTV